MQHAKPLLNTPHKPQLDTEILLDGVRFQAELGEPLIDALNRAAASVPGGYSVPQVCYLPAMGAIGSCDTCMVQVDGKLVRACQTPVAAEMQVESRSAVADRAQREAFDRLLENHDLYCTVCDNNNQNCSVHNSTK